MGGPPGGGAGAPPGGGAGAGGGYAGAQAKMGAQQACTKRPCAAALLGDVGRTTVAGRDEQAGTDLPIGENIYGPYEAGFGTQQDGILAGLGCNPGSKGHVEGGIDTHTADMMLGAQCEIEIPRWENGVYNFFAMWSVLIVSWSSSDDTTSSGLVDEDMSNEYESCRSSKKSHPPPHRPHSDVLHIMSNSGSR